MRFGFIGAGNMAQAMIGGILKAKLFPDCQALFAHQICLLRHPKSFVLPQMQRLPKECQEHRHIGLRHSLFWVVQRWS